MCGRLQLTSVISPPPPPPPPASSRATEGSNSSCVWRYAYLARVSWKDFCRTYMSAARRTRSRDQFSAMGTQLASGGGPKRCRVHWRWSFLRPLLDWLLRPAAADT